MRRIYFKVAGRLFSVQMRGNVWRYCLPLLIKKTIKPPSTTSRAEPMNFDYLIKIKSGFFYFFFRFQCFYNNNKHTAQITLNRPKA